MCPEWHVDFHFPCQSPSLSPINPCDSNAFRIYLLHTIFSLPWGTLISFHLLHLFFSGWTHPIFFLKPFVSFLDLERPALSS